MPGQAVTKERVACSGLSFAACIASFAILLSALGRPYVSMQWTLQSFGPALCGGVTVSGPVNLHACARWSVLIQSDRIACLGRSEVSPDEE